MTTSTAATRTIPPALITHSVAVIKGQQRADVSVHHARTPDARISMAFSGIHMIIYSCRAAQGLLEAFAAARGHMASIPSRIPTPRTEQRDIEARVALSVEWTRRPAYAVTAQSTLNRVKTERIHWIDLYTGPLTWQLRDKAGLLSMIELLTRVHKTAIAVFADGQDYSADPTGPNYRVA
jgi:hypothetical protein